MSRAKGNIAEQRACEYLESEGFSIIERNFYSRFGEIDVIASKGNTLHFIEVKSAQSYDIAISNITPAKIAKLIKTLEVYLKKYAIKSDFSLDAVVVTPFEITLIESITI